MESGGWSWIGSILGRTDTSNKTNKVRDDLDKDLNILKDKYLDLEREFLLARSDVERDSIAARMGENEHAQQKLTAASIQATKVQLDAQIYTHEMDTTAMTTDTLTQSSARIAEHASNMAQIKRVEAARRDVQRRLEVDRIQTEAERQFTGLETSGASGLLHLDERHTKTAEQIKLENALRQKKILQQIASNQHVAAQPVRVKESRKRQAVVYS